MAAQGSAFSFCLPLRMPGQPSPSGAAPGAAGPLVLPGLAAWMLGLRVPASTGNRLLCPRELECLVGSVTGRRSPQAPPPFPHAHKLSRGLPAAARGDSGPQVEMGGAGRGRDSANRSSPGGNSGPQWWLNTPYPSRVPHSDTPANEPRAAPPALFPGNKDAPAVGPRHSLTATPEPEL